jgi:tRNA/tmRNA/rRNA uracil-C5-methylase (TrmA/RlmC/RlmD family)
MEWLVDVPEELEDEIEETRDGNSIEKVNEVFRTLVREPYLEKEIYQYLAEEAINRVIEEQSAETLPVLLDADRGKNKSRFLFDLDGLYVSRFCIEEHCEIDARRINTVLKTMTEIESEEEWNIVERKKKKPNTYYYRIDRVNLFHLLKPLFEDRIFELDEELEEGLAIFIENSYMPLTYLIDTEEEGLQFTLLRELLINIGEEYRNIQKRKALEGEKSPDLRLKAVEELNFTETFAPNFAEYNSEEYIHFVEKTYEYLQSTLPERREDELPPSADEVSLKEMLVQNKARNL